MSGFQMVGFRIPTVCPKRVDQVSERSSVRGPTVWGIKCKVTNRPIAIDGLGIQNLNIVGIQILGKSGIHFTDSIRVVKTSLIL